MKLNQAIREQKQKFNIDEIVVTIGSLTLETVSCTSRMAEQTPQTPKRME